MRANSRMTGQVSRARELSTQQQRYANLDSLRQRPESLKREDARKSYLSQHISNQPPSSQTFKDLSNTTRQPYNPEKQYSRRLNYGNNQVEHFGSYNKSKVNNEIGRIRQTRNQYWTKSFVSSNLENQKIEDQGKRTTTTAYAGSSSRAKNNTLEHSYLSRDKQFETENLHRREQFKTSNSFISNIDKVQEKIRNLLNQK